MTMERRFRPEQYDSRRGEARVDSKLTEDQVREIRRAREPYSRYVNAEDKRRTIAYLAKKYKVSAAVISHVANRKSWRHVP